MGAVSEKCAGYFPEFHYNRKSPFGQ